MLSPLVLECAPRRVGCWTTRRMRSASRLGVDPPHASPFQRRGGIQGKSPRNGERDAARHLPGALPRSRRARRAACEGAGRRCIVRRAMRALVIGVSGQVGALLLDALRAPGHEATGTYARHPVQGAWPLDVRDAAAVEHAIAFVKPDWVLCPGALTHVDYCEDHEDEAMAVNRDGPHHAARM